MTIRHGESYVVETFSQFRDCLDVDWEEIAEALPAKSQEQLLEEENKLRDEHGDPPVEDVKNVHKDVLVGHIESRGTNTVIRDVLDARETEYTHVTDVSIHRIIELHPSE